MSDVLPDYKSSVFLPRTDFPMRGDLPKTEPVLLRRWAEMALFQRLRAASKTRPAFVLHDGPPYANGNLHIGHALNKIHKDVINRARQMAGFDAHYVPGWDCHGLPIEWRIEEQYRKAGKNKDDVPILDFRAECRAYAQHWLGVQSMEFQRLGIEGDWANRYATMDYTSEAAIAAEIHKFVRNGALYRGLRPVMWSPVEKTALAEAEVEYQDRKDATIFVRFPVIAGEFADASIVIWTTTPWTIPGNRALAAGPAIEYVLIRVDAVTEDSLARVGETILLAEALREQVAAQTGIAAHTTLKTIAGADLAGLMCRHPLHQHGYDFHVPMLLGDFVTTEAGTGFVHMAPAHGEDDFFLCRAADITVPETVQDDGIYAPDVPIFAGIHVYKAADPVCRALEAAGNLLKRGEITHSYPHSWRSKAPLIYLARPNWFIRMDGPEQIREKALAAIADTVFVPDQGRNRIGSMVANRPDWCISRQRAWGVPIAIFVRKSDKTILNDEAVLSRTIELFKTEGADAWYARPAQDFLGADYRAEDFEQINDIVDVWFESGSTHAFTLEARGMKWPADLYLEGSDQHRGWFQASLLEAIGTRGAAPFKAIVTDGFVLDEQGRKMSKSLGNVTSPQEVIDLYGADILRLWVMNADIQNDLRIGKEILKQQSELYRRLRNTLRWILGSLDGFDPTEHTAPADMPELERLMLHRLAMLNGQLRAAVDSHDWTGVYPAIHQFCSTELSAFYFDIRKDSLYCDRPDNATRRGCRSFLDMLFRCLATWLAPVMPFTAEAAWIARYGDQACVHLELFPTIDAGWRDDALAARWDKWRATRQSVTQQIEMLRAAKTIGSSLQATALIPRDDFEAMDAEFWAGLCITSAAAPADAPGAAIAPGEKCSRCWRVLPEVGSDPVHPQLCKRCCEAV
jgi:isoleucyl-tRNA synthetase